MNGLKFTFGSLYAVLIILLLLLMLKHCDREDTPPTAEDDIETAVETGGMGKLKITLLWDKEGDVDLHVYEPQTNAHIFFDDTKPYGAFGELDHDNVEGGRRSAENIYWDNPPKGHYRILIHYYNDILGEPIPCKVLVFRDGEHIKTFEHTLTEKGQFYEFPSIDIQ